ncbi:MAG: 23S rRNA (uracil(1939)-C(5))-methyltransferase RlmD [Methylococcaceae bacterium]
MTRRTRIKKLPEGIHPAGIESFTHEGRGLARIEGRPVFIEGALPGEQVGFVYTDVRRDYAEGRAVHIEVASPYRVTPRCAHFGVCGGCSLQHLAETQQITIKQELLMEQLKRIGRLDEPEAFTPLTGPHWGYRHKARLGVKFVRKRDKLMVGFRERGSGLVADLESCLVLHPRVGEHLRDLADCINDLSIRERVPQIEVAVDDDDAVFLIFRMLEEPTPADLERLIKLAQQFDYAVYLQRGGPETVIPLYPSSPERPVYRIPAADLHFRFEPTDFTQVNTAINRAMVARVLDILDPKPDETILDLFCGIGNFTLPLATRAAHVVGVEGSATSVTRARENAVLNGVENVSFHVADLSQSVSGHLWSERQYDKILLDPSRAGAAEILECIPAWQARRIVYVSCNPATLARDADTLVHRHQYRLMRAGVMDMFPHTAHVESMAWFERG